MIEELYVVFFCVFVLMNGKSVIAHIGFLNLHLKVARNTYARHTSPFKTFIISYKKTDKDDAYLNRYLIYDSQLHVCQITQFTAITR